MEEILKNGPRLCERQIKAGHLCTTVLMGPVANGPEQWTGGESHALAILIWVNQPNIFFLQTFYQQGGSRMHWEADNKYIFFKHFTDRN